VSTVGGTGCKRKSLATDYGREVSINDEGGLMTRGRSQRRNLFISNGLGVRCKVSPNFDGDITSRMDERRVDSLGISRGERDFRLDERRGSGSLMKFNSQRVAFD